MHKSEYIDFGCVAQKFIHGIRDRILKVLICYIRAVIISLVGRICKSPGEPGMLASGRRKIFFHIIFTEWLYKKLLLQATNIKSHKMMPLISILTDINKSKTLKDHIAAAAFYQMISNLIYFMREEMLSLL